MLVLAVIVSTASTAAASTAAASTDAASTDGAIAIDTADESTDIRFAFTFAQPQIQFFMFSGQKKEYLKC